MESYIPDLRAVVGFQKRWPFFRTFNDVFVPSKTTGISFSLLRKFGETKQVKKTVDFPIHNLIQNSEVETISPNSYSSETSGIGCSCTSLN